MLIIINKEKHFWPPKFIEMTPNVMLLGYVQTPTCIPIKYAVVAISSLSSLFSHSDQWIYIQTWQKTKLQMSPGSKIVQDELMSWWSYNCAASFAEL